MNINKGMSDKLERQKISERDDFTYDEREDIAKKSGHKCAHCGKLVYFGYGATIDHFVPLSKGGTNRSINLTLLCDSCNKEKGDLILPPETYIKYLNEDALEKLCDYFDSYIHSFEYIARGNLLACDMYFISVEPIVNMRHRHKQMNVHRLVRATWADADRISEYFMKYLKKYNLLMSTEAAMANIEFWLRFGCIYFIEKDGIKLIMTAMVTKRADNGKHSHRLTFNIFSYYNNDYAFTLVKGIMHMVPGYVMDEQGLSELPVRIGIVADDKLSGYALGRESVREGLFRYLYAMYRNSGEEGNTDEFFGKFSDVSKKAEAWIKNHEEISWMLEEINEVYD